MMLLAEATPKNWSSGYTLELGLQESDSTQVQGLQNTFSCLTDTKELITELSH